MENKQNQLVISLMITIVLLLITLIGVTIYSIVADKTDNKTDLTVKKESKEIDEVKVTINNIKEIELTPQNKIKYNAMINPINFQLLRDFSINGLDNSEMTLYSILQQDSESIEYKENIVFAGDLEKPSVFKFDYIKKCIKEIFEKDIEQEDLKSLINKDGDIELTISVPTSTVVLRVSKVIFDEKSQIYTMTINEYATNLILAEDFEKQDIDSKAIVGTYEYQFKETKNKKQTVVKFKKI